MSSNSNLAIVICHGNYHTPEPYQPLVNALKSRGIDTYCPQLATSDHSKLNVGDIEHPSFDRDPPVGGYPQGEADCEIVGALLTDLIERQGKQVLVVAHSAGGWVATESARPELQATVRKSRNAAGGIIGIFYYGAFVIPVGESVHSAFQPKDGSTHLPPWLTVYKNGFNGLATLAEAEKFLFHDLSQDEATKWAATLKASPAVATTVLRNDAYSALPCAYLVLENDRILPKVYQEGLVAGQVAKTGPFKMYSCPAGHAAHLSWTDGIVDTIESFVKELGA